MIFAQTTATDATELFFRTVFDTIPVPTFIVDRDEKIQDYNKAGAQLSGPEPKVALHRRSGDVMHCINSEAKGCGHGTLCSNCVVRNSVKRAVSGGATHRQIHRMELRSHGTKKVIDVLVTASPLSVDGSQGALLMLEDVSELLTLRGLLPICSYCKKVRDDEEYWHDVDAYLYQHMHMKLTHGLCPSCFAKQMAAIERMNPSPTESNDSGQPS